MGQGRAGFRTWSPLSSSARKSSWDTFWKGSIQPFTLPFNALHWVPRARQGT